MKSLKQIHFNVSVMKHVIRSAADTRCIVDFESSDVSALNMFVSSSSFPLFRCQPLKTIGLAAEEAEVSGSHTFYCASVCSCSLARVRSTDLLLVLTKQQQEDNAARIHDY